ncbi:FIST signal transduction protein [Megalodesulfovibrio paquesii]
MHIEVDRDGTVESLESALRAAMAAPGVRSLLVLACTANPAPAPALDALLRSMTIPVFGGMFPAVLHEQEVLDRGNLVLGLSHDAIPHVIHGLSDPTADFLTRLERSLDTFPTGNTVLVLVDGLSTRLASFIDALFSLYGLEVNYLGGGAGSLDLQQQPCIITNAGLVADAGVIVSLDTPSSVAVGQGWQPLRDPERAFCTQKVCLGPCSMPFRATEASQNTLISLDWRPALEVYASIVRSHCGQNPSPDTFLDVARSYPLGIARLGGEFVVRAPTMIAQDTRLVCVGEIPEGAFLEVLHGDATSLIAAAAEAQAQALRQREDAPPPELCLVMTCVSRRLYLGDGYWQELEVLQSPGIPLVGACTIGEIANSGMRHLNLHSNTCVLGYLEQP